MLIYTTRGYLEENLLVKTVGGHENDTEIVNWQEYRLIGEDEIIKREVQMHLKEGIFASGTAEC